MNVLTVLAVSQPAGLILIGAVVAGRWAFPGGGWWLLWAVLAGIGAAIGIAALYRGLAVGSMGIVAPITSAAPLIPLTVALARGERPSAVQLAGIAVALVGVAVAGWEPGVGGARGRAATGAGLALLAAVFFGSAQVGLEAASNVDPYWASLVLRITSSAAVLSLVPWKRPPAPGRVWPTLALLGLLDAGGDDHVRRRDHEGTLQRRGRARVALPGRGRDPRAGGARRAADAGAARRRAGGCLWRGRDLAPVRG